MGPTFIHDKVTLPNYLYARNLLDFDFIKRKLPQDMSNVISFDTAECSIKHQSVAQQQNISNVMMFGFMLHSL